MVIACSKSNTEKMMTAKRRAKQCDGNLMESENRFNVEPHRRFYVKYEGDF